MKKISETIHNETGYEPQSLNKIYRKGRQSTVRFWFYGTMAFLVLLLFLPWTQNIRSSGTVTTLYQDQRPQQINAMIPGRVLKWWVKEGDFVKKGDTIIQLTEVKDDYLDPQLLDRTREQLGAKEQKILFYREKIMATESQVSALEGARELKLDALENKLMQLKRKVISDSAELVAAEIDNKIFTEQLARAKKMLSDGIISLTEFERRTAQFNKALAVFTEKQQKFQNTKQEITILMIDMNTVKQEAADKIFKARGEIAAARSDLASTEAEVAKNRNQLANYTVRGDQRCIIAPQSGQIIKAKKSGINEMVKEGDMIVEIVPDRIAYAVELFVDPMDLVLVNKGQNVRLIFDGFPAIIFSGWPQASYGTFSGKVIAVETNRSENGKFRVLVVPGTKEEKWPNTLKVGAGAKGFAMLKDVKIWYELWRQINGFPPEYYLPSMGEKENKK